jgi:hypothetical protein
MMTPTEYERLVSTATDAELYTIEQVAERAGIIRKRSDGFVIYPVKEGGEQMSDGEAEAAEGAAKGAADAATEGNADAAKEAAEGAAEGATSEGGDGGEGSGDGGGE